MLNSLKHNLLVRCVIMAILITAVLSFFFVSYAEETQPEVSLDTISTKTDATIKLEEKPVMGIQSVGIQLAEIPEAPSVEEANSRFSPTTTYMVAPGDQIDTSTGALIIKQTDIRLPGKERP